MNKILIVLLFIAGCGGPENIPVHYLPKKGLYGVDLKVNGQVVKDVLLDTGSANVILTSYPTDDEPISTPFDIEYGSASGTVVLHNAEIGLGSTTQNYAVGVFTSGTNLHNILGLSFAKNIEGPVAKTLIDSFTLNLCVGNGSFLRLGAEKSENETPILPNSFTGNVYDHFSVQPTALLVDGQPIAAFPTQKQGYLTIVDSGTNLFHYLPDSLIAALGERYKDSIPPAFWNYNNNISITRAQAAQLKTISVEFPNINGGTFTVDIPPDGYVKEYSTGFRARITSAFYVRSGLSLVILGSVFMTNAMISFDKENHKLGFFSNADLCSRVSSSIFRGK